MMGGRGKSDVLVKDASNFKAGGFAVRTDALKEKPAVFIELLEAKIDRYMADLVKFETKCIPGADELQLMIELTSLNNWILDECAKFESQVKDLSIVKTAQKLFREKTDPIHCKSYILNRIRRWPQGHQGDFMTLEIAYRNNPLSKGIGRYLDRYYLDTTLGHAVRARRLMLQDLIQKEILSRKNAKVLDVACGSCREVFEIAEDIKSSGAKFMCLDLDKDALEFARDRFAIGGYIMDNVEFLTFNAMRLFDKDTAVKEVGMQDVVYSVGFFDYLPDEFLVKLLSALYQLLNPGGKLIASFKDAERYTTQEYHWFANWNDFLQRKTEDFERILDEAGIPKKSMTTQRISSGSIIFYICTK